MTPELVGRDSELRRAEEFTRSLADGGAALLLAGGPGIGKTALWRVAVERSAGEARVLQTRCAEVEMPIALGALADLLGDALGEVAAELAAPQRAALEVALGVKADADIRPDSLALARAAQATLELLARDGPVLVAIDDAQWLDPASRRVLAFALRRMTDVPVGLLGTVRVETERPDPLSLADSFGPARFHVVPVEPLSPGALQRLLRLRLGAFLPRPTLARIHAASGGNPMFALEFTRLELALQADPHTAPLAVPDSLEQLVEARMNALPPDLLPLLRAASALERPLLPVLQSVLAPDPPVDDLVAAAVRADALVLEGDELRFAHPLLAGAAYFGMTPVERRLLHGRLAELVDGIEERARHAALAADGPNAATARLVAGAAAAAARRGALDAAAALADEAARIEPDDAERQRLVLEASEHLIDTGEFAAARARLTPLLEEELPATLRGRAFILRSESEIANRSLLVKLLEDALEQSTDPLSRWQASIRVALHGAWISGDATRAIAISRDALAVAETIDDPAVRRDSEGALAFFETVAGLRGGVPDASVQPEPLLDLHLPWWHIGAGLSLGHRLLWAGAVTDARRVFEAERAALSRAGREARAGFTLISLSENEWRSGRWERAAEASEEATDALGDLIPTAFPRLLVLAGRGQAEEARTLGRDMIGWAEPLLDLHHPPRILRALGLLELSFGDAEAACPLLEESVAALDRIGVAHPGYAPALPDLVECLGMLGRLDEADALAVQLDAASSRLGLAWIDALAVRARAVVLLGRGDADGAARAASHAAATFEEHGTPLDEGRARLVAGAALRRLGGRRRAAGELEAAKRLFERLGAPLWAERADDELRRASPRRGRDRDELTAAESRVASLVAVGRTNKEVAAELFTTVATVEAHLTRIYRKLGIRSRSELARGVADGSIELGVE